MNWRSPRRDSYQDIGGLDIELTNVNTVNAFGNAGIRNCPRFGLRYLRYLRYRAKKWRRFSAAEHVDMGLNLWDYQGALNLLGHATDP
ncbi:unnamed protein product, partial [Iphiclides podalirius]